MWGTAPQEKQCWSLGKELSQSDEMASVLLIIWAAASTETFEAFCGRKQRHTVSFSPDSRPFPHPVFTSSTFQFHDTNRRKKWFHNTKCSLQSTSRKIFASKLAAYSIYQVDSVVRTLYGRRALSKFPWVIVCQKTKDWSRTQCL